MSARITRLRLHIDEVSAMVAAPDVSADGKSIDRSSLQTYLASLMKQLDTLEARPDATGAISGGVSLANFNDCGGGY